MRRLAVFIFVSILASGAAQAANKGTVKVWRPKPIFTDSWCSKELGKAREAFAAALTEAKIVRPRPDEPDQSLVQPYVSFLRAYDQKTAARASGQAAAAGEWRGETRYATVKWRRTEYRVGSCQLAKIKIPLNRALAVVNVGQPTETDLAIADSIHKLIAIKKARKACRQLPSYDLDVACRRQYHGYDWLDRYRMD